MDIFKSKPGLSRPYKISTINYEKETKRQKPYMLEKNGKYQYFAVCPECDNPIQLIGLYKNTIESGKKPYGRHYKGNIIVLANYSEIDYLDCPFSNPTWKKEIKRSENSPLANRILDTLEEQFDRVIYILSKQAGIKITQNLAKRMLTNYLKQEGWRYRDTTLNNLPWLFAQCSPAINLYGRLLKEDTPVYNAIVEKCPEVVFEKMNNYIQVKSNNEFINLKFLFYNHQKEVTDDHLTETMTFEIFRDRGLDKQDIIYSEKITVDTDYFANLVKYEKYRNYILLKIARELIE